VRTVPAGVKPNAGQYRGNKSSLPAKACVVCGRPMSWRHHWARNWAQVKYCSEACRRNKAGRA